MSKLSPQAQVVLDSVKEICPAPADEIAAAALRAAAHELCRRWNPPEHPANLLNTIADELEGQ